MAEKKANRRVIDFNTILRDDEGTPIPWGQRTKKAGEPMMLGDAARRALKFSGQKDQEGRGEKITRDEAKKRWKLARLISKPKEKTVERPYAVLSLRKNICEDIQSCIDEIWGTEVQVPANELLDGVPPEELWDEDPESVDRTREVNGDEDFDDDEDEDDEEESPSPAPGPSGEPGS